MNDTVFQTLWSSPDFHYEVPPEGENMCVYARGLAADIENLCGYVFSNPGHVPINQAIVIVVKKFVEYRSLAPKSHRNRISEQGHFCIFHAFERAIQTLLLLEARLAPPMLFIPPPPPAPPPPPTPPQIAGITLGEMDEEEESA